MSDQEWSDDDVHAAIRAIAHNDLPDMRTLSVTEFQAEQLMLMVRHDFRQRIAAQKTRIVNLEAAYDLRGRHLDAAQDRIATLENAIVVSGATLRAIRDEIEGGNDE